MSSDQYAVNSLLMPVNPLNISLEALWNPGGTAAIP